MPETRAGNILLVTLDQLRADVLDGALAGHVPLPNLGRLMAEGTCFSQCWTAAVPCGPSRASLMTGLYAFNHRAIRNGTPLARHHATLGTELRRLGREPLLFGYGDIAADPTGRDPSDPDLATYELPAPGFREIAELRFEAPRAWIGHLKRRGDRLPEPLPDRLLDLFRPEGDTPAIDGPARYRAEDSDTAWLTDRLLEALEARVGEGWTAHLTYIRPHPPLVAPAPYNRLVDPAALPRPAAAGFDHPFRDAWFSGPSQKGLFWGFDGDCAGITAGAAGKLRAVYLGLVAEVDHHLGRILAWLDATGERERTLIVVMADHGEMLGDQGFWGKDNVLAPAHRVPLVIAGPGVAEKRRVEALTSTVDIAPTLIAWCGGTPPPAMDGASLLPFLEGAAPPAWRGAVLTEIDLAQPHRPTRFQTALGLDAHRANAAILRDARWTYVHFNGGLPPLLFDRQDDPDERRDLASDPAMAGVLSDRRAAMLDHRMTRADRRLTSFSLGIA